MVKCGTLRKDKGKPDCWIGIHQWPPPRELQWRSPPLEESWSQSLTMTPRENTDSVSKDKLEKHSEDLFLCYQTGRRLRSSWTKTILIQLWQRVQTSVHSHPSDTVFFISILLPSNKSQIISISPDLAVIVFQVGPSCHTTNQTAHNCSGGSTVLHRRAAVSCIFTLCWLHLACSPDV